jgi:hypothetical protein
MSFFGSPCALAPANFSVVATARLLNSMLERTMEGGGLASLL